MSKDFRTDEDVTTAITAFRKERPYAPRQAIMRECNVSSDRLLRLAKEGKITIPLPLSPRTCGAIGKRKNTAWVTKKC